MHNRKLYGTATVGAKGQVVIPAEAREEMGIDTGDRLYVVGAPDGQFVGLLKEEALEQFVQRLSEQIESLKAAKERGE
jgi:AbrB family looped-hinge helix DNA binding protein